MLFLSFVAIKSIMCECDIETLKQSYYDKEKVLNEKKEDLKKISKTKKGVLIFMKIVFLTVTLAILATLISIFITKLNNWVEENPVWAILISASIGSPVVIIMVVWKKLDKIILRIFKKL